MPRTPRYGDRSKRSLPKFRGKRPVRNPNERLQGLGKSARRVAEEKLRESAEKTRTEFLQKRAHRQWVKRLFHKPIHFKTRDGKVVRILSLGVKNIFQYSPRTPVPPARAMVAVFVDKKRVFFYRSSGESSAQQGRWLPATGLLIGPRGEIQYREPVDDPGRVTVLWIVKASGHGTGGFPKWVGEVAEKIKTSADGGKITFESFPTLESLRGFVDTVSFFPTLETGSHSTLHGRPQLPE